MKKGLGGGSSAYILTFVYPFLGLIYTLSHWRKKWAKNAFWLACVYFGAVMIYWPEGTTLGDGGDGGRYALDLIEMYRANLTFDETLKKFWFEEQTLDIYQPLVNYLLSRFTDNGHWLFAFYALVFGFFYSRNIWYVLERFPKRKLGSVTIFLIILFCTNTIYVISGARFGTATHIFVYGLLPYLLEHDRSKLWWLVVAPLVHFSFLPSVLLVLIFVFLPYKLKVDSNILLKCIIALYLITLLVDSLNLTSLKEILLSYTPGFYENRIEGYVSENVADINKEMVADTNWYVKGSALIVKWCVSFFLVLIYFYRKDISDFNNRFNKIYLFGLIYGLFANIMSLIPSGGRFLIVENLLALPIIMIVAMNMPYKYGYWKYIRVASIFLFLPIIFEIRKFLDYYSITALFGNFLILPFWEDRLPLINLFKI